MYYGVYQLHQPFSSVAPLVPPLKGVPEPPHRSETTISPIEASLSTRQISSYHASLSTRSTKQVYQLAHRSESTNSPTPTSSVAPLSPPVIRGDRATP